MLINNLITGEKFSQWLLISCYSNARGARDIGFMSHRIIQVLHTSKTILWYLFTFLLTLLHSLNDFIDHMIEYRGY